MSSALDGTKYSGKVEEGVSLALETEVGKANERNVV
jgi:hypothetical protein